jgi:hypothetical protein
MPGVLAGLVELNDLLIKRLEFGLAFARADVG